MLVGEEVFNAADGYDEDMWDDSVLIRNYERAYQASRELMKRRKEGPKKRKEWSLGEACRVLLPDGYEYEGTVVNLTARKASLRLHGYCNEVEVAIGELEPSLGEQEVQQQIEQARLEQEEEEEPFQGDLKVGDFCRARWSVDEVVYEGVVESINSKKKIVRVKFIGYENKDSVDIGDVFASKGDEWREQQIVDSKADTTDESCYLPENPVYLEVDNDPDAPSSLVLPSYRLDPDAVEKPDKTKSARELKRGNRKETTVEPALPSSKQATIKDRQQSQPRSVASSCATIPTTEDSHHVMSTHKKSAKTKSKKRVDHPTATKSSLKLDNIALDDIVSSMPIDMLTLSPPRCRSPGNISSSQLPPLSALPTSLPPFASLPPDMDVHLPGAPSNSRVGGGTSGTATSFASPFQIPSGATAPPSVFPPMMGPPPPPPALAATSADAQMQAMQSMLISWYMAGYHTGFYQASTSQHLASGSSHQTATVRTESTGAPNNHHKQSKKI